MREALTLGLVVAQGLEVGLGELDLALQRAVVCPSGALFAWSVVDTTASLRSPADRLRTSRGRRSRRPGAAIRCRAVSLSAAEGGALRMELQGLDAALGAGLRAIEAIGRSCRSRGSAP